MRDQIHSLILEADSHFFPPSNTAEILEQNNKKGKAVTSMPHKHGLPYNYLITTATRNGEHIETVSQGKGKNEAKKCIITQYHQGLQKDFLTLCVCPPFEGEICHCSKTDRPDPLSQSNCMKLLS